MGVAVAEGWEMTRVGGRLLLSPAGTCVPRSITVVSYVSHEDGRALLNGYRPLTGLEFEQFEHAC